MGDTNDFNRQIIAEFRANDGKCGGMFEGSDMLILHSIGAKSGQVRENPLVYRKEGDTYYIFGSKAGMPTDPDWYRNIVANPDVTIEVGAESIAVHARLITGDERDAVFDRHKARYPNFAEYEAATTRVIPVVALDHA
jgi:deazaflavin-dependent oxidoreductase (nitroreductase family)